eukprot:14710018-Heterocapsa_arctica.AAC.1
MEEDQNADSQNDQYQMGKNTHLKQEKAIAAGISCYEWFGNHEADIQAKKGAELHGYTASHKYDILNKVDLAKRVQQHMLK